jgi:hypothetical protein
MNRRLSVRAVLVAVMSVPVGLALPPAAAGAGRYWSTEDVCLPGHAITYVPAPGSDPLTVPACVSPDQAPTSADPVRAQEHVPAPATAEPRATVPPTGGARSAREPMSAERARRRTAMTQERARRRQGLRVERERVRSARERRGAMDQERADRRAAMAREQADRRRAMGR